MSDINKILSSLEKNNSDICDLSFFDLNKDEDKKSIKKLIKENKGVRVCDTIEDQAEELQEVKNPESIFSKDKNSDYSGSSVWVFFPWKNCLVHLLNKEDFLAVKFSRNNNLITKEEQAQINKSTIAFAGMNVGNSGALCMALEGVGGTMKFADFDELSVSNLNRFNGGVCDLGVSKTILSARQVKEINPFIDMELFKDGVNDGNIDDFLDGASLLVEETDNLKLKVKIRELSKSRKIPVIMVTGNGPNLILDIERYDLDDNTDILNDYLSDNVKSSIDNMDNIKGEERVMLLRDFMGEEFLIDRLNESFSQVGKTIAGIPQLAEATFLRGAVLSYTARSILLGKDVKSGRYKVQLDGILY